MTLILTLILIILTGCVPALHQDSVSQCPLSAFVISTRGSLQEPGTKCHPPPHKHPAAGSWCPHLLCPGQVEANASWVLTQHLMLPGC
jgi:hypothetical protein